MRRLVRLLALCAAAAIVPAVSAAQVFVAEPGGPPTTETSIPLRISGLLFVQFHGDPAAGCARWGLCRYSGTVSWQPPATASITIDRTRGRHPAVTIDLFPSGPFGPQIPGGVTSATVSLADSPSSPPAARCVDAAPSGQTAELPVRHGHVTFSLAHESPALLLTRCAGPRDADVIPRIPAPTLSAGAVERGRTAISLATSDAFSAHGFTGSVVSTIVLHLGQPGRTQTRSSGGPKRKTKPGREIDVTYRATVSGSVVENVRGAANPLECAPLGSCGLDGAITSTPHVQAGQAKLRVDVNATTPRRELLAAAGLGAGSPGGAIGFGEVIWHSAGSVRSEVSQAAGRCRDAAELRGGVLLISTSRRGWTVTTPGVGLFGTPTAASHCAGPTPSAGIAASGTAALSSLDRRTARISLTTGASAGDDGYQIRVRPHLTLTLTRLSVRTKSIRILANPFGS